MARADAAETQATTLPWIEPTKAFRRFAADPFVVFLESRGTPGPRSRYSYLCIDPVQVLRDVSLQALRAALAGNAVVWPDPPVPFTGGAAGFCAYEHAGPPAYAGVPNMQFGLFDLILAWDHPKERLWLLTSSARAASRAPGVRFRLAADIHAPVPPRLHWTQPVTRQLHVERVARALDYIKAGDIYQANITAPFVAARPAGLRAADLFLALRDGNAAPFTAFIGCGDGCAVASVSPERFLSVDRQGHIEARPIKGTRPRGASPTADAAEAAALLGSEKDRAENLMIVDLLRNDLSRVTQAGSVRVPVLHALESFASVHHLVSVVQAVLQPDRDALHAFEAAFPGGSITGAPKIRAMQIIAELEARPRGPYCGCAAWFGCDGAMDSSILIRTVTVAADQIVAQAGGGIVAESDPASEWEELLVKARPMLRALGDWPT